MNAASSTAPSPASSTSVLNAQNGVPAFGPGVVTGPGFVAVVAVPAAVFVVTPDCPAVVVPVVAPVESPGPALPPSSVEVAVSPSVVATTVVSWPIGIGWPIAVDPGSTVVVGSVAAVVDGARVVEGDDEAVVSPSLPHAA